MTKVFRILCLLIGILLFSWIMLHAFAIFGVFLALCYPIWWLFFPNLTPCLLCNSQSTGSTCLFCNRLVNKTHVHPANHASVIKNSLLILLISLISIGLVIIESKLLYHFGIPSTSKTASFTIPSKSQYNLEQIFPMKIEIAGISTPINAVQADINFDPHRLKIMEITTNDSFANVFIQKEINNEAGYARLTGGLPNPGFIGDHGLFGTIFFQGLQPGIATIQYLPSSKILANDGRGTNILKNLGSASYLILPEKISSLQKAQQSTLFVTNILGVNADTDQLTFYETNSSILGSETPSTSVQTDLFISSKSPNNLLNLFSRSVATLNNFILRFWVNVIYFGSHP